MLFVVISSEVEECSDAIKRDESELSHALVGSSFILPVLSQDERGLWVALFGPVSDVALVLGDVHLSCELVLQQHQLAFHALVVDRSLNSLMVVKDRPETGSSVGSDPDVLGGR